MTSGIDGFSTATEMLAALDRRDVSSAELTDMQIERIERLDGKINAVVVRDFAAARERAVVADARRAAGEPLGKLDGLPHTLKESTAAAGLPQTAAMPAFAGHIAEADGPVAAKVRAAGGVLLGKTNIAPFLADIQSNNTTYGRSLNPWNPARTPGGSTGGGGAAVAAGLSPLEFGSDIGGSIRIPALFCGIYGHRPSETVVSRSGAIPVSQRPNVTAVMGVQGPLARSAEDIELALDVISGPEAGEDTAWKLELPRARHERLADMRVAVLPAIDWCPVDNEILESQDRLASALGRLGAKVATAGPAFDMRDHHKDYLRVLSSRILARMPAGEREATAKTMMASDDEFTRANGEGANASAVAYFELMDRREQYREAYRAFFREWDILLAPTTIFPAIEHNDLPLGQRVASINGEEVPFSLFLVYSGIVTLAGQPSLAFPTGLTRSGLPIGLQAIGPYLEDRTPIRFGQLVAKEIGGYRRPPGFE